MELAYRLAVSDEPYIQQIRDNVIVSITGDHRHRRPRPLRRLVLRLQDRRALRRRRELRRPSLLGQVRVPRQQPRHQLRRRHAARPPELVPELGAADLARPARGADAALHLQRPAAAERQLDPILYSELMFFANYEVNKLTGYGMPGVWHFGFIDMWSPGYLGFAAANHNGMLRMYESSTRAAPTRRRPGSRARRRRASGSGPSRHPPARSTGRSAIRSTTPRPPC